MSIFPFYEKTENKKEELDLFSEYAYDFSENKFKLRGGKEYLVFGDEALKIWITKALITDRFKFLAYFDDYGSEINTLIGLNLDEDIAKLELKRYIIEALMVNPYIVELSNFNYQKKEKLHFIEFDVKTIYGGFRFEERWQV